MRYANEVPTATRSDAALASQLRIAVMRLARRLRAERLDTTHTLTQLAALATVERHGPITPGDLASHERVQPPSMTRVLGRLEDDGLVRRSQHPTDGRQQLVAITNAGRELLAADRRRREAWLSCQLAGLADTDVAALSDLLPLLERLAGS